MKKIVFVIGNYKNGGMAMRATNLANEFVKNGFNVDILVTKQISTTPYFDILDNVHIISLSDFNSQTENADLLKRETKKRLSKIRHLKSLRILLKWISSLDKAIEKKIRFIRQGIEYRSYFLLANADIVVPIGVNYLLPTLSGIDGMKGDVFYAEKNAPETELPSKGTKEYNDLIQLLKQTKGIIVQTQSARQFFDRELNNVFVINNPIKNNLPLPFHGNRRKTIVNFCRMSSQKNLELLVESFYSVHKRYPDYSLEIYGNTVEESEELYKEQIINKIHDLGLADCATILPSRADIHKQILDYAMFVSSSNYEGLSNSMIEAMAIGLPCICTDCLGGGTREVIENEVNGLIVPLQDADALYQAIVRFIEYPELAAQCGRNAEKIKEVLSADRIAQQWLEVLQGCIK